MRYLVIMALFVLFLIVMVCRQATPPGQSAPIRVKPTYSDAENRRVIREYEAREAARAVKQQQINLQYLSDVAERNEFRRRYKITYGKECPY